MDEELTDEQLYALAAAMAARRAAEGRARLDMTIAAVATALSPKALAAWGERQRARGSVDGHRSPEEQVAARDRALLMLSAQFPGLVKVS